MQPGGEAGREDQTEEESVEQLLQSLRKRPAEHDGGAGSDSGSANSKRNRADKLGTAPVPVNASVTSSPKNSPVQSGFGLYDALLNVPTKSTQPAKVLTGGLYDGTLDLPPPRKT